MPESWNVDLANVAAIYPMQGTEVILVIIGVVTWLAWHIVQTRQEDADYVEDIEKYGDKESIRKALDEHAL